MSATVHLSGLAFGTRAFAFVPGNVRRALGETSVPLLSSELAAICAPRLSGPVVELSWPGTSALIGALRAARRANAALALVMPDIFAVEDPGARLRIARAVLALAEEARFDRPLFLVRQLRGQSARTPEEVERLKGALAAEVEAGFPSIALRPGELGLDDLAELGPLIAPFALEGVGFELELEGRHEAALALASLDEAGVRFAAVRGASADDELGGALLVVDPFQGRMPSGVPCRVSLDAFVVKGIARALPSTARDTLLRALRSKGATKALTSDLDLLAELDDGERARVEAMVYAEVKDALQALGADDVGDELEAALDTLGEAGPTFWEPDGW